MAAGRPSIASKSNKRLLAIAKSSSVLPGIRRLGALRIHPLVNMLQCT